MFNYKTSRIFSLSKCYKFDEYLLLMPWEPKERQCTPRMIELLVKHSFQRGKPSGPAQASPQQLVRREQLHISQTPSSPGWITLLHSVLSGQRASPCFKTIARSPCRLLYLRLRLLSIFHMCLNSQFHN